MLETMKCLLDGYKFQGEFNKMALLNSREFFSCLTYRKIGFKRLERLVIEYYLYSQKENDYNDSISNAIFITACNEILSNGKELSLSIKRLYEDQFRVLNQ